MNVLCDLLKRLGAIGSDKEAVFHPEATHGAKKIGMSIDNTISADSGSADLEVRIGASNSTRPTLWMPE